MEHNTVVVRLMGGLGNQMFQYAAARGLAEKFSGRVCLDISWYETAKDRPYQLDKLHVPQIFARYATNNMRLRRILTRVTGGFFGDGHDYVEKHFHFDPHFADLAGSEIFLYGHFQSPLYFANCEPAVREHFQLREPFSETARHWADEIRCTECSVSVHVRRGDYVTNSGAASYHANLDAAYYMRAIALAQRAVGKHATFFIFSDEPDDIAEIATIAPETRVVRSSPDRNWEDLFLMGLCEHNIIANSSYSWWGAWLNQNSNKLVIAPQMWFSRDVQLRNSTIDLFPRNWVQLR